MALLLVVIPTTGGPAILRRLGPRAGLPVSSAFADGDYRPLPWSADYARMTAPGGPLARAMGRDLAPHELRLHRSFDAGRSWEAPVAAAHLMLASGRFELTDQPDRADLLLWATGAVDLDLALIAGDYSVARKLELSHPLFEAAEQTEIVVAAPPGTTDDALAALEGLTRVRILREANASGIAAAAGGAGVARDIPTDGPKARRSLLLPIAAGAAALSAAAAAAFVLGPALLQSSPPPEPKPPVGTVEKPVETPPAPPPVAIDEVRAPAGSACAQVLFGSVKAERRPVAPAGPDAFRPTRLDGSLCGVSVRPLDPKAVSARVTGGLAAAASPPRPEQDGGFLYMLKAGVRQNVVYEVQAVARDGGRPLATLRHELVP